MACDREQYPSLEITRAKRIRLCVFTSFNAKWNWPGKFLTLVPDYCSLAYSTLAPSKMGMVGSASFYSARKS